MLNIKFYHILKSVISFLSLIIFYISITLENEDKNVRPKNIFFNEAGTSNEYNNENIRNILLNKEDIFYINKLSKKHNKISDFINGIKRKFINKIIENKNNEIYFCNLFKTSIELFRIKNQLREKFEPEQQQIEQIEIEFFKNINYLPEKYQIYSHLISLLLIIKSNNSLYQYIIKYNNNIEFKNYFLLNILNKRNSLIDPNDFALHLIFFNCEDTNIGFLLNYIFEKMCFNENNQFYIFKNYGICINESFEPFIRGRDNPFYNTLFPIIKILLKYYDDYSYLYLKNIIWCPEIENNSSKSILSREIPRLIFLNSPPFLIIEIENNCLINYNNELNKNEWIWKHYKINFNRNIKIKSIEDNETEYILTGFVTKKIVEDINNPNGYHFIYESIIFMNNKWSKNINNIITLYGFSNDIKSIYNKYLTISTLSYERVS